MNGQKLIRELTGLFFVFCGLLILLSLWSYDVKDPTLNQTVSGGAAVKNSAGLFGACLAGLLTDIFGFASFCPGTAGSAICCWRPVCSPRPRHGISAYGTCGAAAFSGHGSMPEAIRYSAPPVRLWSGFSLCWRPWSCRSAFHGWHLPAAASKPRRYR